MFGGVQYMSDVASAEKLGDLATMGGTDNGRDGVDNGTGQVMAAQRKG
jgi:hypothetical protein